MIHILFDPTEDDLEETGWRRVGPINNRGLDVIMFNAMVEGMDPDLMIPVNDRSGENHP